MKSEWGFSVVQSKQSDRDRTDNRLLETMIGIEPSIMWCIGCGTCSATCSAGQYGNFSPRRIFQSVRTGYICELRTEIDHCLLCEKCLYACPRQVNTRNILFNLKRMVVQNAL